MKLKEISLRCQTRLTGKWGNKVELNLSSLQTTKAQQTKSSFDEDDLFALEQAATKAKYPSEKNIANVIVADELDAGNVITFLNPNETCLWEGNPRNFSFHSNLVELVTLVKASQGNVTPVIARRLSVKNKDGIDIEIIAGSRRRAACIEASVELKVNLIECNDEEAKSIAELENKGRKDPDIFTECRYLKYIFNKTKVTNPSFTVEMFAKSQVPIVTRQTMNDKLKLAELPLWLQETVKEPDAWSFRKAVRLKSLLNNKLLNISVLEEAIKDKVFATPDGLLSFITMQLGLEKKNDTVQIPLNNEMVAISTQKSGMTKIVIPKGNAKLISEIETLIKSFSNNK